MMHFFDSTIDTDSTHSGKIAVLVHGIFDTPAIFARLSHVLRRQGWICLAVRLRPNTGRVGLDRLAVQLKSDIDRCIPCEQPIDLIAFSMGGLVARYYLQRLGGLHRIRRLITVSAPHQGSRLAYLLPNRGGRQMRPHSAFLADLNRDADCLKAVDPISLWSPWDLSILPAKSSILKVGRSIKVGVPLHVLMLWSRSSIESIVQVLKQENVRKKTNGTTL
ncbi:lipase [candidate division KSB1 bacterium]|nr:lipase [candidate division KSB1 bacterium]